MTTIVKHAPPESDGPFIPRSERRGLSSPAFVSELVPRLGALWPKLLSYALSFVIVGIYWVAHHNTFHYIKRSDRNLLWLNILLMMCIVFIPFPTALLGQYPEQRVSVIIYAGTLVITGLDHGTGAPIAVVVCDELLPPGGQEYRPTPGAAGNKKKSDGTTYLPACDRDLVVQRPSQPCLVHPGPGVLHLPRSY